MKAELTNNQKKKIMFYSTDVLKGEIVGWILSYY